MENYNSGNSVTFKFVETVPLSLDLRDFEQLFVPYAMQHASMQFRLDNSLSMSLYTLRVAEHLTLY